MRDRARNLTALLLQKPYLEVTPEDIAQVKEMLLEQLKEEALQG